MNRFFFIFVFCVAAAANVFAQLPQNDGQTMMEYPLSATSLHAPRIMRYQEPKTPEVPLPKGPTVIDLIKRETGEAAWSGPGFGLIGQDQWKLYVYHNLAIQQKVGEVLTRFQRQETKNVPFVMSARYITLSEQLSEKAKIDDIRQLLFPYLHPILGPDRTTPICRTPGVSAYWVDRDDISRLNEAFKEIMGKTLQDSDSNALEAPKLTTLNGQWGVIMDVTQKPFVTDYVPTQSQTGTDFRPIHSYGVSGQTVASFSLLSLDGQTVETDILTEFSTVESLEKVDVKIPGNSKPLSIEIPDIDKVSVREQGLRWPVDGMLVLLFSVKRTAESKSEKKSPFSLAANKSSRFTHQTVWGIMTVKRGDPIPGQGRRGAEWHTLPTPQPQRRGIMSLLP